MKIAVFGTGLIGTQVTRNLTEAGHDVSAHSLSTGVNLLSPAWASTKHSTAPRSWST